MKESFRIIFKTVFHPWINLPWNRMFNTLLWALKLWCLNLALYFTIIFIVFIFSFLEGTLIGVNEFINFTQNYFYNGSFLGWESWRIHVVLYIFGLLYVIKEEL